MVTGGVGGVEVNLAGWDGTLRGGTGKERKAAIKGIKKEEETERTKKKNQKGDVKRGLKKDGKKKRNNSSK